MYVNRTRLVVLESTISHPDKVTSVWELRCLWYKESAGVNVQQVIDAVEVMEVVELPPGAVPLHAYYRESTSIGD